MNQEILDDLSLEKACRERFNLKLDVAEVLVRAVPTGIASHASVFKTAHGQVFVFIAAQSGQTYGEVQKIIFRMQCEAAEFVPPHGDAEYFTRIGQAKFKAMFPGKHITSDEDLRYYKNLASYNPALVRIAKVHGEIRGFDATGKVWRKVKDYSYSTIKPS